MTRRHKRTPSIIAIIGSVIILAGLPPAPLRAQSGTGTAGQITVAPAGRAPSVTQDTPVEPTAEQLRMREEGMRRSNPPGPPLPVSPGGPTRQTPLGPSTEPKGAPKSQAPAGPKIGRAHV